MQTMRLIRLRINRLFGLSGVSSTRKKIVYIVAGVIVVFLLYRFFAASDGETEISLTEDETILSNHDADLKAEKWVVITTIRSPTDAVRKLAEQPDWKVVVVGDRKTPATWSLPNVIYLSPKLQKSLGYRILKHLSYNTYARKSIGYLYAIQHGAKYIYETDDDNYAVYGLSGFQSSDDVVTRLVLSTNNLTNNPYVHFGQSTMWPRGYPLDRIGLPAERRYDLCEISAPPIQQGVVNGDPDVDALFRLTRRQSSSPLRLTFDRVAPPFVLPPHTFAPFNSQNTFFGARALWALLLPVTSVPDRAIDIYRAYWAQRLLWLIGDAVAFAPPNAVQTRNQHADLDDARDEAGLYQHMTRYISTLDQWQCDSGAGSLFDCVSQLSRHLVSEGLWLARDASTVDAWLADLAAVGYAPPPMTSRTAASGKLCKSDERNRGRVVFYPVEQNTSMPHTNKLYLPAGSTNYELVAGRVASACTEAHRGHWLNALAAAHKYANVLLVISVPGNIHTVLPGLEAFYRIHFPNILYCVQDRVDDEFVDRWRISVLRLREEVSAVPCLLAAGKMQFGVRGFLHVSANMLLNAATERMTTRIESLVWMPGEFDAYQQSTQRMCHRKTIACRHMSRDVLNKAAGLINDSPKLNEKQKTTLRTCISKLERDPSLVSRNGALWVADMLVFVPLGLIDRLSLLHDVLTSDLDLMAALMLECEQLTVNYMQRSEQVDKEFGDSNSPVDYFLPFEFGEIASNAKVAEPFCSYFERFS